VLAPGSPLPLATGGTQVGQGLALKGILSTNMHLEPDTTLVSSGASPVTLTPGGGGENTLIARPTGKPLFVYSIYLFY